MAYAVASKDKSMFLCYDRQKQIFTGWRQFDGAFDIYLTDNAEIAERVAETWSTSSYYVTVRVVQLSDDELNDLLFTKLKGGKLSPSNY